MADLSYALPRTQPGTDLLTTISRVEEGGQEFVFLLVRTTDDGLIILPSWQQRQDLGIRFVARPFRDSWMVTAIADGIAASDDQVVGQLQAWDNGDSLWITPPAPTPRGLVVIRALRALQQFLADAIETTALLPDEGSDGIVRTDDEDLVTACSSDLASRRLRSWSADGVTFLHLDGEAGPLGLLCTVVTNAATYDVLVGPEGDVGLAPLHPAHPPQPWGRNDETIRTLAAAVAREAARA